MHFTGVSLVSNINGKGLLYITSHPEETMHTELLAERHTGVLKTVSIASSSARKLPYLYGG
jgi:hypothetical protein